MSTPERGWKRGLLRGFGLASGLGLNFALLVTCGALVGRYIDKTRDGSLFTVLGVALGSIAAFVNMLRVLAWFQRREEQADRESES